MSITLRYCLFNLIFAVDFILEVKFLEYFYRNEKKRDPILLFKRAN